MFLKPCIGILTPLPPIRFPWFIVCKSNYYYFLKVADIPPSSYGTGVNVQVAPRSRKFSESIRGSYMASSLARYILIVALLPLEHDLAIRQSKLIKYGLKLEDKEKKRWIIPHFYYVTLSDLLRLLKLGWCHRVTQ